MSLTQAAQQNWDAMPWWQKALVSYGKGASDVVRGDLVQPAKWAAELLSKYGIADPETGHGQPAQSTGPLNFVAPGSSAAYGAQTKNLNEPFNTLQGLGPRLGSSVGSVATLLPAAVATDGLADASLPEASGGGLLGGLRRVAPLSTAGATMGALEPDHRAASALFGAVAPGVGAAGSHLAFPLLRALHGAGALSAGSLYDMLLGMPALAGGAAEGAAQVVPRVVRKVTKRPGQVAREAIADQVEDPLEEAMQNRMFGGND